MPENKRISQFGALAAIADGDLFVMVDDPSGTAITKNAPATVVDLRYQSRDTGLDEIAALLPTKGVIIAGNGTSWVILDAGNDNDHLVADSTQASGVKWTSAVIPNYGSMWLHEVDQLVDISGAGQGVYVKVTGWTEGEISGTTFANDAFTTNQIGTYKLDWQVSGDSQGVNKVYEFDIFVNGSEIDDGSARRSFGSVGSQGSMSGTAVFRITDIAHEIDLRVKEPGAGAGTDFNIFAANFNIIRLGD